MRLSSKGANRFLMDILDRKRREFYNDFNDNPHFLYSHPKGVTHMKITDIRIAKISVPLRVPFKTALRTVNSVEDVIVEIHTDTGLVGYGEAPPTGAITGDTTGAIIGALRDHIIPKLKGQEIDAFEPLMKLLDASVVHNTSAKAAVDIALYDLYGQMLGAPVYKLLGASRKSITTDITISVNDPEEMARDTIAALEDADIVVSGNGTLGIFEKNGVKVGMTGYCFPYKDGKKDISKDVKALREAGCQIVIASFHWGSEYREDFTREQRSIGRQAIKAGADIVVGHHPHIVQGVEAYQDSYILYSLGNFIFGGNVDPDDRDAYAARLTFTVYEDRCDAPEVTIVPLRLTELSDGTDYRPVIAEGEEAERIVNRILKRSYNMDDFENGVW